MHDDNFLSPSFFWLIWNLSACLLWGLQFSHSKHTEEIGTLWANSCDRRQNRQKVFTFRVYNTTKKYSHCYSCHQLKLYTISPHPLLFNLGLLQFGVKWQIIFFSPCVSHDNFMTSISRFSALCTISLPIEWFLSATISKFFFFSRTSNVQIILSFELWPTKSLNILMLLEGCQ